MKRYRLWIVPLVATIIVVIGCGMLVSLSDVGTVAAKLSAPAHDVSGILPNGMPARQPQRNLKFVMVTHSQAIGPFWSVVKKGVDQAALDMRVTVDYRAPDSFDVQAMSALIDEAVASKPDGLIVSIPDAEALSPAIRAALKANIPVITMNSGSEVADDLNLLSHVGQPEYEAGFGAGEHMALASVTTALCFTQEPGNAALDFRCKGFEDAMAQVGGTVQTISVDTVYHPDEARVTIHDAIAHNVDIDGILSTGVMPSLMALDALRQENRADGSVTVAGFDMHPDVLEAIRRGDMLFTVDQQPYVQGYMPVVFLTLRVTNLNSIPTKVIMTGPSFVTAENVDQVIKLSQQGTR